MWKLSVAISFITLSALGVAQTCNSEITESTPTSQFIIHGNGTVTDRATGLTWMQCSLGQVWSDNDCQGEAMWLTWNEALVAAESQNFAAKTDWRLPNVKELISIVEYACYEPATNLTVFPNTPNYGSVWTSTPSKDSSRSVWVIELGEGISSGDAKKWSGSVRLVRN